MSFIQYGLPHCGDIMLTREMWIDYCCCPHKFDMLHNKQATVRGDEWMDIVAYRFRGFADYFWAMCDTMDASQWFNLIPNFVQDYDRGLMEWFIDLERLRLQTLRDYDREDEWHPPNRTMDENCSTLEISGRVDRIDWWRMDKGEKCLVTFILDEAFISKDVIRRCIFDAILSGCTTEITHGRIINPVTKKVKTYEITERDILACLDSIKRIKNSNTFKKTCTKVKHSNCLLCMASSLDICGEH